MGRKYLTLASALLLALCLNACGSRPGTVPPPSGGGEGEGSPLLTPASHDDCYWTAVRHESYNPSYGRTEVSTMPTENGGRISSSTRTEQRSSARCSASATPPA